MMKTKMISVLKGFAISMLTGALLLAVHPVSAPRHVAAVAAVDPNIFHHWPTAAVAEIDPDIFHHWPDQTASV